MWYSHVIVCTTLLHMVAFACVYVRTYSQYTIRLRTCTHTHTCPHTQASILYVYTYTHTHTGNPNGFQMDG